MTAPGERTDPAPTDEQVAEGDTVWIPATVVRAGGIGGTLLLSITGWENNPGSDQFAAVFRESKVSRGDLAACRAECAGLHESLNVTAERAAGDRRALDAMRDLFAGGPDTSCRTVWDGGIECASVPLTDLRAALAAAQPEVTT